MSGKSVVLAVCSAVLLLAAADPWQLVAQDDFRHLDEGRPLRVEDAYPIKFREWEWELGSSLAGAEGGALDASGVLELKTGLFRNAQLGVEVHGAFERLDGASSSGLEEVALHVLYNLNQEGDRTPAFGFRADIAVPGAGDEARTGAGGRVKAMLTRSFGRSRVHLNSGYSWANVSDGGESWDVGFALDRVLGLSSRLLAGDVFLQLPTTGPQRTRVWVDLGVRFQVTKQAVLDVGVFSRLDEWDAQSPNAGVVVGLSRAFGVRSLVPLAPYRRPRLR